MSQYSKDGQIRLLTEWLKASLELLELANAASLVPTKECQDFVTKVRANMEIIKK